MTKNQLVGLLIFVIPFFGWSQSDNYPLNNEISWQLDKYRNSQAIQHTFVKPYLFSEVLDTLSTDTISRTFKNVLLKTNLIDLKKGDFSINVNPDIDFNATASPFFQTEYGLRLSVNYKNKVSFWGKLNYGLATLPNHVDSIATTYNIIPGKGSAYNKGKYYAYNNNEFSLSYSPNNIFNFELGRAKHFWGNGYRTFMLSDNSKTMPYFKITTSIWKLKYVVLWQQQTNLLQVEANDFQKNNSVFNHLSWNATKKLNIGLFQTIKWSKYDTIPGGNVIHRGWDFQYANPFIFFKPLEQSLGSPDNALLGMDSKYIINNKNNLYFQIVFDELSIPNIRQDINKFLGQRFDSARVNWWGNKYAIQMGWKSYDVLGVKGLDFQQELNTARPYIYTHNKNGKGYTNYNQALAHPLGANFRESITFVRYKKKKIMAELKVMFAAYGADSSSLSHGGNVLKSYTNVSDGNAPVRQYGVTTLQGLKTNLYYQDLKLIYFINPKSHLRAEAIVSHRTQTTKFGKADNFYLTLGIKTTLGNSYTDF